MADEHVQSQIIDSPVRRQSRRQLLRRAIAAGLTVPTIAEAITPEVSAAGSSAAHSPITPHFQTPPAVNTRPKGGTLIVAQAGEVDSLDNDKALGPSKSSIILYTDWQWIGKKVVESPIGRTVDTSQSVPRIIEQWEINDTPSGGQEYIFTVRQGMQHHSGNPITAHDIDFVLRRRRAFERDGFEQANFFIADDEHLQLIDDYTLSCTTDQRARFFMDIPAQRNLVDSAKIKAEAGADDPWGEAYMTDGGVNAQGVDSGGGPFLLTSWTPGVELTFERFDGWWGNNTWEQTVLDRVNIRTVPSTDTRLLLLQRGEVDIAFDIPQRELNRLQGAAGVKVISFPSTNQLFIGMNPAIEPFGDVKVRQAMNYAFPFQVAIDQVFGGAAGRMTGCVQAGLPGALESPMYETDLDTAKQLLQEAGFGSGAQVTLSYSGNFATHEELAILYQANLREVGVTCELQRMQQAEFNTATRQRELPFFFNEVLWWVLDPQYSLDLGFISTSHNNTWNFQDPAIEARLDEARNFRGEETERAQIYHDINRDLTAQAPWVFIAHPNFNLAMREEIEGYVYQNTELHHLWLLSKRQ